MKPVILVNVVDGVGILKKLEGVLGCVFDLVNRGFGMDRDRTWDYGAAIVEALDLEECDVEYIEAEIRRVQELRRQLELAGLEFGSVVQVYGKDSVQIGG